LKITVITVAFNAVQSIADTLESVASQTHRDIEHIVVDGASTDGTLELVKTRGGRVAQLVSEPDEGIYDAMNKGLRLASGDVIGFLNADDVYANTHVLEQVSMIMETNEIDALLGDAEFFDPAKPTRVLRRYRSERFRPDRIGWGWMPAHPALFLTRLTFERFGPFRTDYCIAGDFELVARIFGNGALRYQHIPEVLVRMRTGGVSTRGLRNTYILNKEVLRACRENAIDTNVFKILSKYPMKLLEFYRS
jgi:glycosyltransferase involved in cell wall biosynthesis